MFSLLHKDCLALDISDEAVTAVKLKTGENLVEAWGRSEIPKGLVLGGKILNPELLAKEIEKLLDSTNPFPLKSRAAFCHLPDEQVYFQTVKLPNSLNPIQTKRIIDNEIDNFFPFTKEELYWQNRLLTTSNNEQEILVVAAPKEVINGYLKLFGILKIRLLALGIASESLAHSLIKEYNKEETILLVDIGRQESLLALFDKTGIRTSLNINLGGQTLTAILVEKLKVNPQQAENLKSSSGFDETKEEGRVFLALQAVFQGLIKEIKKTINFYKSQTAREIKKIIISGQAVKLIKLDEYLVKNLSLVVEKRFCWLNLPPEVDSSQYERAIGLALLCRQEYFKESINFLGRQLEEKIKGIKPFDISARSEMNPPAGGFISLARLIIKTLKKPVAVFKNWPSKLPKGILVYLTILIFLLIIFFWLIIFHQPEKINLAERQFPSIFLPVNQSIINTTENLTVTSTTKTIDIPNQEVSQINATSSAEEILTPQPQPEILKVKISKTPTGWLNVRQGPTITYSIIKKIYPGEIYFLVSTTTDWIQINLGEELHGWIKSDYGEIIKE
jgi:type IV pilus assembly protein PilM